MLIAAFAWTNVRCRPFPAHSALTSYSPLSRTQSYRYLFGPVPSRRFGRSLGVDLLTPKTCTYDCPFCEVGRTTRQTMERRSYAPVEAIIGELQSWANSEGKADYITVAGSGEPTLHSGFGDVLDAIRRLKRAPSALLTNGSMLYLPEVRAAAARADVVKASLSAWDEQSFIAINRPHSELTFQMLIDGLQQFRREFKGQFWLEVVIIAGLNDSNDGVRRISAWCDRIHPDRVHLNTVVRPPAYSSVAAVSENRLKELSCLFRPPAELIASFAHGACRAGSVGEAEIVAMVARRPCTLQDVAATFAMEENAVKTILDGLQQRGILQTEPRGNNLYYRTIRQATKAE